MKKRTKNSLIVLFILTGFFLLQACASAPKLPDPKPGLYVNEEYRFSVAYPENWNPDALQPGEVLRAANENPYKLPVITASIGDLQPDSSLDPEAFTKVVAQAIPGTKRFKVLSQEDVTLNDGTAAKAFTYKWTWADGATKLVTGALISIKDNKFFTSTATTILGGETRPEQLLELVKSWKFY